jgi:hypothetical protein
MPLKRQQPNRTESARVTAFTFKTIPQGAATTACSGSTPLRRKAAVISMKIVMSPRSLMARGFAAATANAMGQDRRT